jgi:hypothetical protein
MVPWYEQKNTLMHGISVRGGAEWMRSFASLRMTAGPGPTPSCYANPF